MLNKKITYHYEGEKAFLHSLLTLNDLLIKRLVERKLKKKSFPPSPSSSLSYVTTVAVAQHQLC